MTKYIVRGDVTRVTGDANLIVSGILQVGTYTVGFDEQAGEFFLKRIEEYSVGRIYGDMEKKADRILKTYLQREASTGVLLSGQKGTGKTLLAKLLSVNAAKLSIPTLVINQPLHGEVFNTFVQSINQPCVILFDEFEKMYDDQKSQASMLTLLDGVYPTKKLFVLTTNDRWKLNEHMINRPGRLFYHLEYGSLTEEFIIEYCKENLIDKEATHGVVRLAAVFEEFNFDMLKAMVEEMNRYGESAREATSIMNVRPYSYAAEYIVKITSDASSEVREAYHELTIDPFKPFRAYFYKNEQEERKGYEGKAFLVMPSHMVSAAKGNYVFKVGELNVKISKKPADAGHYERLM